MDDDPSRDFVGGDRDDGPSGSTSPRYEPMRGMLDKFVRVIHQASGPGHDHAPTLAEHVVDAIELKTDDALRLELDRRVHRRVEQHLAIGEPKIHRVRHGAARGAEDHPPHTAGLEARPTLRWCQWLENRARQRISVSHCFIPVTAEKARRRGLKSASDLVERR